MNARCYGASIDEILDWVEYVDEGGRLLRMSPGEGDFGYKDSPFQHNPWCITRARFSLQVSADREPIRQRMEEIAEDRRTKGHFSYPCAGSVFKNDRRFGKPSGQIIDELGLKGSRIGDAEIAPFHGNIIINKGNATADDIFTLTRHVQSQVYRETGFLLEPEIIFLGFKEVKHEIDSRYSG